MKGIKGFLNGEKHWNWKGGLPKCIDCGKQTKKHGSKRCFPCHCKFLRVSASINLQSKYWLGKKRPEIKKWLNQYQFKKGFLPPNKGKKGYINKGSFKKDHLGMRGKNNPFYKHGLSKQLKGFYERRRELRKKGNGGSHTFEEWEELKRFYSYMCLCCKKTEPEIILTEDHIIPVNKKGSDDIDNIQPLCQNCNNRKYTKTIDYRTINSFSY